MREFGWMNQLEEQDVAGSTFGQKQDETTPYKKSLIHAP